MSLLICTQPKCQTSAGCICSVGFGPPAIDWDMIARLAAALPDQWAEYDRHFLREECLRAIRSGDEQKMREAIAKCHPGVR